MKLKMLILMWLIASIQMSKPGTSEICGMQCPKCKANPGCMKGWNHFGNTEHWCMNCAHQWGP